MLAAQSFMMGSTNFVLVGLPAGWKAGKGPFPPEVDRRVERGEASWAVEGQASFELQGPLATGEKARGLLRLYVGAGEGGKVPGAFRLARVDGEDRLLLGGHEGVFRWGWVRTGLGPWASFIPAAAWTAFCPATGRSLHLLVESSRAEAVDEVARAVAEYWRCH